MLGTAFVFIAGADPLDVIPKPIISFSSSSYQVAQDGGSATIEVRRTGEIISPVTVHYSTTNGTAASGSDYTALSQDLEFRVGETSRTFDVPVVNDASAETDETVLLTLSSPGGGAVLGSPSTATLTILDTNPALYFSSSSYSVGESASTSSIQVSRFGGSTMTVSASYATSDGTATSGSDYVSASGTLLFAPGDTSKTFAVPIAPDSNAEMDETVGLSLSSPTGGAAIGVPGAAVLTILDDDSRISFASTSFSAGEAVGSATITVSRVGGMSAAVGVSYSSSNGTADSADFTGVSGALSFAAGETSKTFSVPVTNDSAPESDETVNLAISSPTGGAALSSPTAVSLTILDNDPIISFASSAVSISEAAGGTTVTVNRQGGMSSGVGVSYSTSNGTATAGFDYTAVSGTLSFGAGEASKTFSIPITNDSSAEADETLIAALSTPTGGATLVAPTASVLTILDNDPLIALDSATDSLSEAAGSATITATRQGGLSLAVGVSYASSDITATAGSDYTAGSGTLSFSAGQTTKTFTVPITNDTTPEVDEAFNVSLSSPTGGANLTAPSSRTVTLVDDDPGISFGATAVSSNETAGSAVVTLSRQGGLTMAVGAAYSTSDGSASAGSDYTATSGTVSFAAGETTKTFSVAITNDSLPEADETLNLVLSNPTGGAVLGSPSSSVITIVDNDPAISFSSTSFSSGEALGSAVITVSRQGGVTMPVGASYSTSNGSAVAGADYTSSSGTISFAAGETSKTFAVPIINDTAAEPDEAVGLSLSAPTGGAAIATPSTATLTILDNDPVISLNSSAYSVGETGAGVITVSRQGGLTMTVGVSLATSNGTAIAGSDYTATSGTVSFSAGQTSKTFSVPITGDTTPENDETLNLTLSAPTGGATLIAPTTGVLTIVDDDPIISFSSAGYSIGEAGGSAPISVTRQGGPSMAVGASYATSDGTATAGSDYTGASGTVSFAANETSKSFNVAVTNDALAEPNETVGIALSAPSGGASLVAPSSATLTIVNRDPVLLFSSPATSKYEDAGDVAITVVRQGPTTPVVGVSFATSNGTALAGSDYDAISGTLSFTSGVTTRTFNVKTGSDGTPEPDETINLALSSPTGGAVVASPSTAVHTIRDDDIQIDFNPTTYSVSEGVGNAALTVTRQGGTSIPVTVDYSTKDRTALPGLDYVTTSGAVTFGAGETTKTIFVPIIDDSLPESSEYFDVSLANVTSGAKILAKDATVTIIDNDSGMFPALPNPGLPALPV